MFGLDRNDNVRLELVHEQGVNTYKLDALRERREKKRSKIQEQE